MNRVTRHTFRGKRYRIIHKPVSKAFQRETNQEASGTCDHPLSKNKTINLDPSTDGLDQLRVIIHESLHACLWDLDEEAVEATAQSLARFLWRLGYMDGTATAKEVK